MYKHLTVTKSGTIGRLHLSRPEVRNAFNNDLIAEIEAATLWFDRQAEVKVVIVSGEGKSFCSGFDLKQFTSLADPAVVRATVDAGRRMAQTVSRMRAITIAAVQGHCVGGGVVLMAACDFRIAAHSAQLSLPETDIGIPLAWGGVPALVREGGALFAAEFILTCRAVGAEEALRRGMVNDAVADEELSTRVDALAQSLTRHSALVLETTKSQLVAAKQSLLPDVYSFTDAHALHSALVDSASRQARSNYLEQRQKTAVAAV